MEEGRARALEISFKCFLAVESVNGEECVGLGRRKRGESSCAGYRWNINFKALIGHKEEAPKSGIAIVAKFFLSWIVLDHFIRIKAPSCEKMTSPLARCLVLSKVLIE